MLYAPVIIFLLINLFIGLCTQKRESIGQDVFAKYRYSKKRSWLVGLFLVWFLLPYAAGVMEAQRSMVYFWTLRFMELCLCGGFLATCMWQRLYERYALFLLRCVLSYVSFSHTLAWLCAPTNMTSLLFLGSSMLVMAVFLQGKPYMLISNAGVLMAFFLHEMLGGNFEFYTFGYLRTSLLPVLCMTLLGLFFIHWLQALRRDRIEANKTWALAFGHELNTLFQSMRYTLKERHNPVSTSNVLAEKCSLKEHRGAKYYAMSDQDYRVLLDNHRETLESLGLAIKQTVLFSDLVYNEQIRVEDFVTVAVGDLMAQTYSLLPLEYRQRTKLVQGKSFPVYVHRDFMQHVFNNLVKNAFDHGKATEVTIGWDASKRHIYVKDNGIGISRRIVPYMFDLFSSKKATQPKEVGKGIIDRRGVGLRFVKMVLAAMDADIWYHRGQTGESIFYLTFS